MKPFIFRLEKVLRCRHHQEKRAQKDLFRAKQELLSREQEIHKLKEAKWNVARRCREEVIQGIHVPQFDLYRCFLQKLNAELEKAKIRLKKGEEKVEVAQAALKQASINKKTLERFKELKLSGYLQEAEGEAQKALDEMVLLRRGVIQ